MFRSLHMKLVMIMLLLVTSLMAVVGAFLMTSVTNFYIDDFYEQMSEVFGESNAEFVSSLREEAAQEDGAVRLQTMLEAYSGTLSIDSRNRNYYVLDGRSGEVLASSNEDGQLLEQTENILTARNGEVGDHSDLAASYMDGGFSAAKEIIDRLILCDVPAGKPHNFDYKTALQELVQREPNRTLVYRMAEESGPDHDKTFTFEVLLNGAVVGRGEGHSKKEAEQMAARAALERLE